jgi:hypothetical protein
MVKNELCRANCMHRDISCEPNRLVENL